MTVRFIVVDAGGSLWRVDTLEEARRAANHSGCSCIVYDLETGTWFNADPWKDSVGPLPHLKELLHDI